MTDAVERDDLRDRFGHKREPAPPARVEDHRLIVHDQILAEIEPSGDGISLQRCIDAVDSGSNLVDSCSGVRICFHDVFPFVVLDCCVGRE